MGQGFQAAEYDLYILAGKQLGEFVIQLHPRMGGLHCRYDGFLFPGILLFPELLAEETA
jgi:hypothetical protein